jgi:hypothetical protein
MNQKTRRRNLQRIPYKTRKNRTLIKGGFSISRFFAGIAAYISAVKNASRNNEPTRQTDKLVLLPGPGPGHQILNFNKYHVDHPVKDVAKYIRIGQPEYHPSHNHTAKVVHNHESSFHSARSQPSVDRISRGLTDHDEPSFHSAKEEHIAEEISRSLESKSSTKRSFIDEVFDKVAFVQKTLPILGELTSILTNHTLSPETEQIVNSIDSKYDSRIIWKKMGKKYVPTIEPHGAPNFISDVVKQLQKKNHFKLSNKDNSIISSIIHVLDILDKATGTIPNSVLIKFFRNTIQKMERLKTLKHERNKEKFNKVSREDRILKIFLNMQGLTYDNFDEKKFDFFKGILTVVRILVSIHNTSEQNAAESILKQKVGIGILSEKEYKALIRERQLLEYEEYNNSVYDNAYMSAITGMH